MVTFLLVSVTGQWGFERERERGKAGRQAGRQGKEGKKGVDSVLVWTLESLET